mmetsp:Transcript_107715/g.343817  ORF Transcript_107715/g.343817 Transcript_107715/m.343817 type:complete len:456 (-) Transcript_107715:251-1618(-)
MAPPGKRRAAKTGTTGPPQCTGGEELLVRSETRYATEKGFAHICDKCFEEEGSCCCCTELDLSEQSPPLTFPSQEATQGTATATAQVFGRKAPRPGEALAKPAAQGGIAMWLTRPVEMMKHMLSGTNGGVMIQVASIMARHLLAFGGLYRICRGWVGWRTGGLGVGLWIVSGLGVTAGAHRLWSHQAYQATPAMQALLIIMFSIADQGTIVGWTLTHAMHHAASDTDSDPHNRMEGFWHAHFGWLYSSKSFRISQYDYNRVLDGHGRLVRWHDTVFLFWDPLWSLAFPALVASFWGEAVNGFWVAGAFRWMCVQHITFFVNSVAHGEREAGADEHSFDIMASGIGPRVSLLTTILALGEGWHDYHHLFPWDYAAAELDSWDQWNPTKVFIDICGAAGIVTGRRRCSSSLQEARRKQMMLQGGAAENEVSGSFKVEGPPFLKKRVMVPLPFRKESL